MTADTTDILGCAFKVGNSDDAVTVEGKTQRYIDAMPYAQFAVYRPRWRAQLYPQSAHFLHESDRRREVAYQGCDYDAQVTASPAVAPLLRLACCPLSTTSASAVYYRLWITYHVHFFEVKVPSEST